MSNLEKLYRQFGSTDPGIIHSNFHKRKNLLLWAIDEAMDFRLSAEELDYLITHKRTDLNLSDVRDGNAFLKILGLADSYNIQLKNKTVEYLLKNTDLKTVDCLGNTALMLALHENAAPFLTEKHIHYLFKHCDLSKKTAMGGNALLSALENQFLIQQYGSEKKDPFKVEHYTAMYEAVKDKAGLDFHFTLVDKEFKELWDNTKTLINIYQEKQKLEKDIKKATASSLPMGCHKI